MSENDRFARFRKAILALPDLPAVSGYMVSMWLLGTAMGAWVVHYGHLPVAVESFIWGTVGLVVLVGIMEDLL